MCQATSFVCIAVVFLGFLAKIANTSYAAVRGSTEKGCRSVVGVLCSQGTHPHP